MPARTTANRLGSWSAFALLGTGIGYAITLAAGIARHGWHEPITDPVLAILELLTMLAAPAIVTLLAAVLGHAAPDRKVYGVVALVFGALCAGTTSVVHFVELTSARQMGDGGLVWPSHAYAAELLAWDVFLGIALLFAAAALGAGQPQRAARRALLVCGILCLAGTVGPVVGDMRLQRIGIVGYAGVLPIVALLLARWFKSPPNQQDPTADPDRDPQP